MVESNFVLNVAEKSLTLSLLNYELIKCLSADELIFQLKTVITDVPKRRHPGLPGGRLSAPPAVKGLN